VRLTAVGAYKVRPGFRAIRDAFRSHGITERVRQEMRTIVLLEFEVRGASTRPLRLEDWHQRYLRYVPYREVYFSLDRRNVIPRGREHSEDADFALAFYIHFFDPKRSLVTPHGNVRLPEPVWPRPAHLRSFEYAYWD
jgi:hypothetical protein